MNIRCVFINVKLILYNTWYIATKNENKFRFQQQTILYYLYYSSNPFCK